MLKQKLLLKIFLGVLLLSIVAFVINKFLLDKKIDLKSEKSGNINVLLLGRGGGTHDGPDLTDTIMLAMINPTTKRADLISIPRDLWVPDIKGRINSAYHLGQVKDKQGKLYAKAVVEKVTGQNIDYVVVIDFSGFIKLIDYLGGVDVNVTRTLDDYNYPIEGKEREACGHADEEIKEFTATASAETDLWEYFPCRYKHLHVDAGTVHMTGKQALEFSRSRHGVGSEGSDFARSRRQDEVISAIRSKVLSLGIILNPVKIFGIAGILQENIDTDVKTGELDDFINLAREMQGAKIESFVIDFGDGVNERYGLLIEPTPSEEKRFQYNLVPRTGDGNFSEIREYVKCIEQGLKCEVKEEGVASAAAGIKN
ncbi:MAG: hypothetical protein A2776_02990 [Candidatus Levybacteria bacterium RIFCSPHIGHO2_01_FULL_40_10]|nr:MAG: hypothetical protein A2776_02990 [Candidatus Levybacteria bacterium RIFCSPHIGHO2_01_FULL_40_10]